MANTRAAQISQVLWITLGLNLAVAVAKLIYGYRSGAIAITADGLHSVMDGMSNVVALVGIAVASRPPDANHPYGHRKYETMAALGVAAMLLLGCREILVTSLERWRHPQLPSISAVGFVVVLGTLAVNFFVVMFERKRGRQLKIYYTAQTGIEPPRFTCFCNDPRLVHFSYLRYLENTLRGEFTFEGTPLRIEFRGRNAIS